MDATMSTSSYIPAENYSSGSIFSPTDFDLINYYLKNKISTDNVWKLDIYRFSPDQIREIRAPFRRVQEENMFIITPRHKLNGTGNIRPSRSTPGGGYWHMTGKLVEIKDASDKVIGTKTTLTWYQTKGVKSAWIMNEYTFKESDHGNTTVYPDSTMLDEVICKMHKTGRASKDDTRTQDQKDDLSGIENLQDLKDDPFGHEKYLRKFEDLIGESKQPEPGHDLEDTGKFISDSEFDRFVKECIYYINCNNSNKVETKTLGNDLGLLYSFPLR